MGRLLRRFERAYWLQLLDDIRNGSLLLQPVFDSAVNVPSSDVMLDSSDDIRELSARKSTPFISIGTPMKGKAGDLS